MIPLLVTLIIAGSCPKTIVINDSSEAWNDKDQQALDSATKRCKEKFPDAPCLKKFWKKEPQTYWALCGAEEE